MQGWDDVLAALVEENEVRVPRFLVPHPISIGMRRARGLPRGQLAHYRMMFDDASCLHVHEYLRHYHAHLDRVDPRASLIGHMANDTPRIFVGAAATTGAVVGAMVGGPVGALVGAGVGTGIGAASTRG